MEKIGTYSSTKKTLDQLDFHVKKKFGQNFLTDQNILRKIVNIPEITNETLVVEIGPGLGAWAANEIAVYAFLKNRIGFLEMTDLIENRLHITPGDVLDIRTPPIACRREVAGQRRIRIRTTDE